MNCMFLRRRHAGISGVAVTVTGTGDASKCYAVIGGITVIAEGEYTVQAGDVIVFGVYGARAFIGTVTINGTTVVRANASKGETVTYNWTIPDGTSAVAINFQHESGRYTITVTTS